MLDIFHQQYYDGLEEVIQFVEKVIQTDWDPQISDSPSQLVEAHTPSEQWSKPLWHSIIRASVTRSNHQFHKRQKLTRKGEPEVSFSYIFWR